LEGVTILQRPPARSISLLRHNDLMRQLDRDAGAAQFDHGAHGVGGVKAVGLPGRQASLGVETLGATRGVPVSK